MGRYGSERKRRDPMIAYHNKIRRITNWYNRLMEYRKENPIVINPNTKQEPKRRELKELSYYIDKIKKPKGE